VNRIRQWFLSASWARQFAFNFALAYLIFGTFQVLLRGWAAGLVGAIPFTLAVGGFTTWSTRRKLDQQWAATEAKGRESDRLDSDADEAHRDGD
jgi:hypothetical protein